MSVQCGLEMYLGVWTVICVIQVCVLVSCYWFINYILQVHLCIYAYFSFRCGCVVKEQAKLRDDNGEIWKPYLLFFPLINTLEISRHPLNALMYSVMSISFLILIKVFSFNEIILLDSSLSIKCVPMACLMNG